MTNDEFLKLLTLLAKCLKWYWSGSSDKSTTYFVPVKWAVRELAEQIAMDTPNNPRFIPF